MALDLVPKEAGAAEEGPTPVGAGILTDRQRRARQVAYVGCLGALGYGVMKIIWALGGRVGLRPGFHIAPAGLAAPERFFDYWGTPILCSIAIVILLGLVYPGGSWRFLRLLLRILAWSGSLVLIAGVGGLIQTLRYYAGDLSIMRHAECDPGTYLFTYVCFLMLGVSFAATAWLTRRNGDPAGRHPRQKEEIRS